MEENDFNVCQKSIALVFHLTRRTIVPISEIYDFIIKLTKASKVTWLSFSREDVLELINENPNYFKLKDDVLIYCNSFSNLVKKWIRFISDEDYIKIRRAYDKLN